jgi:hypothetical protein
LSQISLTAQHCPFVVWPGAFVHCCPDVHTWHLAPFWPHDPFDSFAYGSHELLLQQPLHAAPPHEHAPAVHESLDEPHVAQAPAAPHMVEFWLANGTHVSPLQQPIGHEVALHVHCPETHAWPVAHAVHAFPPVPQKLPDSPPSGTQVPPDPPLQQPFGHVAALHFCAEPSPDPPASVAIPSVSAVASPPVVPGASVAGASSAPESDPPKV